MSTITNHIVHKVLVQLHIDDQQTAMNIQNQVAAFVHNELFPLLEEYFSDLEQILKGNHLQVSELNIELHSPKQLFGSIGRTTNKLAVDHLLNQFRQQVEQQLRQWSRTIRSSSVIEGSMTKPIRSLNVVNGREKPSENTPSDLTSSQRMVQSIIYIMEHGHRPWWLGEHEKVTFFSQWNTMDATIKDSFKQPALQGFFKNLPYQPNVLKRLIDQFSNDQLGKIYHELMNSNAELTSIQLYKTLVNRVSSSKFRMTFWRMVFGTFSKTYFDKNHIEQAQNLWKIGIVEHPQSHETIFRIIDQIHHTASRLHHQESWSSADTYQQFKSKYNSLISKNISSNNKTTGVTGNKNLVNQLVQLWDATDTITVKEKHNEERWQEEQTTETDEAQLSEGIYVDQAGLVLLHPFISQLFHSTGLMDQDKNIQNKTLAVHLLHYLATKQENAFEQDMVFEKYCCNVGLETSLQREVSLPQQMKDAAEELLQAVIGHWTAIKNTHADTLRAEFFNRQGKLVTQGNHHKLVIERKTQDVLLDQLPWNISLVKFPWKQQLLFVEWGR
ncbi:hypothetical protein DN752_00005 [Echinicola strongylocentroti]|uniref:Uncharacterized protein n=1 Tax=Echinicola strongylocentroti TaxID=1795355 RepID=A0A2Z4IQI4_9BACT|nr:contractile injection system tape measure protein [Echinicola strongylocentroti]AWW32989.1 hypothetical protein DN752_00005 [Echinicola strongylocentroti]